MRERFEVVNVAGRRVDRKFQASNEEKATLTGAEQVNWLLEPNYRNKVGFYTHTICKCIHLNQLSIFFRKEEDVASSPENSPSKQSTMKKQSDSLDRKVKLILSKDLGDPDELKADEPSSDEEQGLNTVKEEDISSAEDGTLLKVLNLKSSIF